MDENSLLLPEDILRPLWFASMVTGLKAQTLRSLGRRGKLHIVRPAGPTGNMFVSEREIMRLIEHGASEWWTRA